MNQTYAPSIDRPVFEIGADARATFIARTYAHLFGAIGVFTAIEVMLFRLGFAEQIYQVVAGKPMIIFGAFFIVSWLASSVAYQAKSLPLQYLALGAFVTFEAIFFVPLLFLANTVAPGAIASAAVVTMGGFGILTFIAFWTRKDFSFLGALLRFVGFAAIGGIIASLIFGFHLGTWFSVAMVAFAGGAILFDTSNILHRYPEDRYVGAALGLFASVAMMFWYVLRIFIASRD